jgi:RHS repeat-associated protein
MKKLLLSFILFIYIAGYGQETIPTTPGYHDTQGALDISAGGQAIYSVPIALPPSIQDVGPTINLTYSSGQLGGIAGMGWSISTVSTIARTATRPDIDGIVDGVDFDSNDKLSLDGQRLLLVSGTYFASGSVYATEVASNTKIELTGSGTTMYFIVTLPDGSRKWYGNYGGQNAADLTAFYIVRFEDTNGNFITYHYTKPYNKALCINEIKFSANTNGLNLPLNRIKFNYKQAKRTENVYINGVKHEKVELLSNIYVYTNGLVFRKYVLTHDLDSQLGYERVTNVQEFNGNNEEANPIEFQYDTTISTNVDSELMTNYTNNVHFNEVDLSGDFDGDGRLDFVADNNLYRSLFQNGSGPAPISFTMPEKVKLVATTLTNNKLNQFSSIVAVNPTATQTNFKVYNLNGNSVGLTYTKTVNINNSFTTTINNLASCQPDVNGHLPCVLDSNLMGIKSSTEYLEGDFNGDGISEVIVTATVNEIHEQQKFFCPMPANGHTGCNVVVTKGGYNSYLVDLNPNAPTEPNTAGFIDLNTAELTDLDKKYVSDFNGDGKADILVISSSRTYKLYTINQLTQAPWGQLEIIGQGTLDSYSKTKQLLLGDFNGDGKTDIILPDTEGGINNSLWNIYYSNSNSTAGSFFVKESHNIVEYWPNTGSYYNTQTHFSTYYALDTNGDGKSDLVRLWRKHYKPNLTINDHNTNWRITTFANNTGNINATGNKFTADYSSSSDHDSDSPDLVVPIVSNYKYSGMNRDIVVIHNHYNKIYYINFTKDVAKDARLKKVITSNGAIQNEITYAPMEPTDTGAGGLGSLSSFYSSTNSVTYPYIEMGKLSETYLVKQLKNTTNSVVRYQDFKYHGLMIHMKGLGNMGFKKTARSEWSTSTAGTKMWNITESSQLYRAAPYRSYSQLLTSGAFSFVASGLPTGTVSENLFDYQEYNVSPGGLYYFLLKSKTSKDYLTSTAKKITYTYDGITGPSTSYTYLLPTLVKTDNYGNTTLTGNPVGSNTLNTLFDNNPGGAGANYYIGRPKETTITMSAYANTFTTFERLTYTDNKLTRKESRGNTTESKFLVEDYEYNAFGNLKKQTISSTGYTGTAAVQPRITEYTYDTSERFIKTTKDIEGLVSTNVSFHPVYGMVTESTNPFNMTQKSFYDNWGKVYKTTDYLGKITSIAYAKQNSEYSVTTTGADGSAGLKVSDVLGRVVKVGGNNINGTWFYTSTEYDSKGRKYRVSEPYISSPQNWTTFTYDNYDRLTREVKPSGVITNVAYTNNTVQGTTVYNDGTPSTIVSSTKDANGSTTSTTDMGGTINYIYYASGKVLNANYNGNMVTTSYDEWGNKIFLHDMSVGFNSYMYNALGELLSESTPNGTMTNTLDDFGKIITKSVTGTNTNSTTTFTYNPTNKLVSNVLYTDTNNGGAYDEYTYTYDEYNRIYIETENKFGNFYQSVTFYDDFGRPRYESYTAIAEGKSSSKAIRTIYKNGYRWQLVDNETNAVLWQVNDSNERGQLTSATYGNGIALAKTYDGYGYLTQTRNSLVSNSNDVLTLNTSFENQRGNLLSRSNTLFYLTENFQYDGLDRLTHYTNTEGITEQQTYQVDGRIATNNAAVYNYSDTNKKYNNTSIDMTPESSAYYKNRLGIFNDSMETMSGWAIYEPAVVSYDNTVASTGAVSLKIANTTTGEKIVQSQYWINIDNEEATEYTYSVKVKSDGTNPQAEIFLYMKDGITTNAYTIVDQKVSATSANWVTITKTFLVPANIKLLNIRLDNNGLGNLWFDDVHIRKAVAKPTSLRELNISYNQFKSPYEIVETGVDRISFTYNYANNRSSMIYGGLSVDKMTRQYRKYYSSNGAMEIKHNTFTGEVEFVTYIGGDAYSAPIVYKSDGTTGEYLYLHRDYLASIVAITNASAQVVEKRMFDAWGEIVRVQDKNGNILTNLTVLDRGYTGHEHLGTVGLIHMNGRLYDPKLHRFLQPDNNIQDPNNTQNYNRYGYVLNNPLKYSDPSGEEAITLVGAIIVGAIIAATTYTLTALLADVPFSAGGFIKSAVIGAASGAVTFGIGTYANTISQFGSRLVFQALAHGTSQAIFSGIQGGNPLVGFASGALSSFAASMWMGGNLKGGDGTWGGLGGKFAQSSVGTLAFGTIMGGAGAKLTGGNFWEGAATGLAVTGLNHLAHNMGEDSTSDDQQQGKKVTKETLGIKKGDSPETMIGKLLKGMKPGDYIDGSELDFLDSQIGIILDKATMSSNGTLQLERTFAGRLAGVGKDAKLIIKAGNLNGMKGFNYKLSGISSDKILKTGFINDHKSYYYEGKQLYSVKIK